MARCLLRGDKGADPHFGAFKALVLGVFWAGSEVDERC